MLLLPCRWVSVFDMQHSDHVGPSNEQAPLFSEQSPGISGPFPIALFGWQDRRRRHGH